MLPGIIVQDSAEVGKNEDKPLMVEAEDPGEHLSVGSEHCSSRVQPVRAASSPRPLEVPSQSGLLQSSGSAESEAEARLRQVWLHIIPAPAYDSPAFW